MVVSSHLLYEVVNYVVDSYSGDRNMESDRTSVSDDNYETCTDSEVQDDMTVTMLGKTKTLAGLEKTEWIFVVLSTLLIFATVGLTIHTLTELPANSPDVIFAILLLINAGFCLCYTIHGVLREREFELYCLIIGILIVSVYVVVDFFLSMSDESTIKKVRVGIVFGITPFVICLAWVVGQGFGYLEFKTVGAAAEVQGMYRAASRLSGLLKLDYQLAVTLLILTIDDASNVSYFSKCSLAVGVPLQLLANLICWIAMRTEQLALVWLFLPFCLVEPVYIGYEIFQWQERWTHYTSSSLVKLTYSSIVVASCALIVRILLMLALYVVVRNFGRGLKYKVFHLPINENDPPVLLSKRQIKKCCGMVCCGPIG